MSTTRIPAAVAALAAAAGLVVSLLALVDWQRERAALQVSEPAATPARPETPPSTDPAPAAAGRPTSRTGERVTTTSAALAEVAPRRQPRPVRLTLGGDLDMPVRPVGVATDGQMQLPRDPAVLGWYRFGPAPGERRGSAVLAGHLDTVEDGIGPLVRLREARRGDRVTLTDTTGRVRRYEVVAVDRYDRRALPAEIFDRTGPQRLRLVTCGGAYVPGRGYEQNLVVTARPL